MTQFHVTIEFDVESDIEAREVDADVQSGVDDMAHDLVGAGRLDTLDNVTVEVSER